MTNILEVEKAKNGNSCCWKCGRIIFKDTTRLVLSGNYRGHSTKSFMCPDCGMEYVKEEADFVTNIYGQLRGSYVSDIQIETVPNLIN